MNSLHYACSQGKLDIVQYLLSRDVDPRDTDNEGELPSDFIDGKDSSKIENLLQKRIDELESKN